MLLDHNTCSCSLNFSKMVLATLTFLGMNIAMSLAQPQPSLFPSSSPTDVATVSPSMMPTIMRINKQIKDCNMTFTQSVDAPDDNTQEKLMPGSESIGQWENVTASHIYDYLESIARDDFDAVNVNVVFESQTYVGDNNLRIYFDVTVIYADKTEDKDFDMNGAVGDAFITWNSRQIYIAQLNMVNEDVFPSPQDLDVYIEPRRVEVNTASPTSSPVSDDSGGLSTTLFMVILACAGGGLISLLLAYIYIQNKKSSQSKVDSKQKMADPEVANRGKQVQVSTYIVTKPIGDEDISTLGYPTVTKPSAFTGRQVVTRDEDISTLGEPTIFGGKSAKQSFVGAKSSLGNDSGEFSTASDSLIQNNLNIYGSSSTIASNPTVGLSATNRFSSSRGTNNFFEFDAPAGSVSTLVRSVSWISSHIGFFAVGNYDRYVSDYGSSSYTSDKRRQCARRYFASW